MNLEVCFSPLLFDAIVTQQPFTAVVCDIFRATTSFCTAFHHGVKKITPIASFEELKKLKEAGHLVAGERDGQKPDFADFGNDPTEFTKDKVSGKEIYYSTTNGVQMLLKAAERAEEVIIASFLNMETVTAYLLQTDRDVVICCSGWKGGFGMEDALFAGALTEKLLDSGKVKTSCDSAHASLQLWKAGKDNPAAFVASRSSHLQRLILLGKGDILDYAFQMNICPVLPVMRKEISAVTIL
jgi:2-phosphosulfolactate phosphatase